MSTESMTVADIGDRHRRQGALALILIGATLGLDTLERVMPEAGAAGLLEYLQIGCALVAVGLLVPTLRWKLGAGRHSDWNLYRGEDGFVADSVARAQIASWSVTFLLLCALSMLDRTMSGMPPEIPLRFVAAVMAIVFGGAFLYLTRAVPDEEDDEFGGDPRA